MRESNNLMDNFCIINIRTGDATRCQTAAEVIAELACENPNEFAVYRRVEFHGDLSALRQTLESNSDPTSDSAT